MDRLTKKIIKTCGRAEDFVFDFMVISGIDGASDASDIRWMKEYVKCVKRVERESKKKLCSK